MIKETESEETIGFFVIFLSLVVFQSGGVDFLGPQATLMELFHRLEAIANHISKNFLSRNFG